MAIETQFRIWIDPDFLLDNTRKNRFAPPEVYVEQIRALIFKINTSRIGRILLQAIRHHGQVVRISPMDINPFAAGPSCVGGGAVTVDAETKDGAINIIIQPKLSALFGDKRPIGRIRAAIRFSPHESPPGGICFKLNKANSSFLPTLEQILLHELVHALRLVSNKFIDVKEAGGLMFFDKREEFFAVLVENIFLSETKFGHLRSSHLAFNDIDKNLAGSLEFFKVSSKSFELVAQLFRDNSELTGPLSKIDVPFNPIRAFYCHPGKAKEMARSPYAKTRDSGPLGIFFAPLLKK